MNAAAATAGASRAALGRIADVGASDVLMRSTTALCSPLCVASGRVPQAIAWLSAAGFTTCWTRTLRLRREHVEALWEQLILRVRPRRVDAVAEAMTVGPAILLGLSLNTAVGHPAADHLAVVKGRADPATRDRRTLRDHLGAPNLLTSLVHTPDTADDMLRELDVLLPDREDLEDFWTALNAGEPFSPPAGESVMAGQNPPPPLTALVVGLRIRERLLTLLLEGARRPADPVVEDLRVEIRDQLRENGPDCKADPNGAVARYQATFEPRWTQVQQSIAVAGPTGGTGADPRAIGEAYAEIEFMAGGQSFDVDRLTAGLAAAGVPLDPWERVVLRSEHIAATPGRRTAP